MKRSEINSYIREAEVIFRKHGFLLPPWVSWAPAEWRDRQDECASLFESSLGWDITDFGSEDYLKRGLLLVTIRNGNKRRDVKPYAEKIMLVKEDQETPFHFHWQKTEDIINRGGGYLLLELYNSDKDEGLSDRPVDFLTDGISRRVEAGGMVRLRPGESITLTRGMYHRFYAEAGGGPVVAGEVSMTNDDAQDNRFLENCGRFPAVIEDEAVYRPLVSDYNKIFSGDIK